MIIEIQIARDNTYVSKEFLIACACKANLTRTDWQVWIKIVNKHETQHILQK
jgi:hypothetical protein